MQSYSLSTVVIYILSDCEFANSLNLILAIADITTFRPDLGKYYERFASSATHQMHPSAAPAKRRPSAVSFGAVQTTPAEDLLQTLDGRRRANRRSDIGESDDSTRRV